MRIIGFITEPGVITRIVDHLRRHDKGSRPPPQIILPLAGRTAASPA